MTNKNFLTNCSLSLFSLGMIQHSAAQTFSYDGNRWYEIEVSIFTNQYTNTDYPELFLPEQVELFYPEPYLKLTPALSDYYVDFAAITQSRLAGSAGSVSETVVSTQEQFIGPEFREENTEFRLIDKSRDPFIALNEDEHEFTRFNRNIDSSPEHRILYHAVWRQPVLNKVQARAILISGGDHFDAHSELEGSLTISYNINRVDVDARLWRNSFNIVSDIEWNVPLQPLAEFTDFSEDTDSFGLVINQVYPMVETRQMISNELHYLDHPALGMLIEVRPYELPPLFDFSLD